MVQRSLLWITHAWKHKEQASWYQTVCHIKSRRIPHFFLTLLSRCYLNFSELVWVMQPTTSNCSWTQTTSNHLRTRTTSNRSCTRTTSNHSHTQTTSNHSRTQQPCAPPRQRPPSLFRTEMVDRWIDPKIPPYRYPGSGPGESKLWRIQSETPLFDWPPPPPPLSSTF